MDALCGPKEWAAWSAGDEQLERHLAVEPERRRRVSASATASGLTVRVRRDRADTVGRAVPSRGVTAHDHAPRRGRGRELVLEAAVAVLASGGIEDLRIARVARMAGVSPALVHYHFETREALVAEALARSYQVAGDVSSPPGQVAGTVLEQLVRRVETALPLPGSQRHEWELWIELWLRAVRQPKSRVTAARVYARLHESYRALLEAGVERGEFDVADTSQTADRILAIIDGWCLRALIEDPAVSLKRAREEILAMLRQELGLAY